MTLNEKERIQIKVQGCFDRPQIYVFGESDMT